MENMTSFTKIITDEERTVLLNKFYAHVEGEDHYTSALVGEDDTWWDFLCVLGNGYFKAELSPGRKTLTIEIYNDYAECYELQTETEMYPFKFVTIQMEDIDCTTTSLRFELHNTKFTQFELTNKELFDFVNDLTLGHLMSAVEKVSGENNLFQVSGKIFCGRGIEFTDLNKTKGFIRDIYPMDGGFVLAESDMDRIPENLRPFYDEAENVNGRRAFALGFDTYETLWTVC